MEEEIQIISAETRKERIINFFSKNKKVLIFLTLIILLIPISFFSFQIYKNEKQKSLAKKYNTALISFKNGDKSRILDQMISIIEDKNATYSPLAFYYLLDNNLINSKEQVNNYFDLIINDIGLNKEMKELNIYKKGLYNSESVDENELLEILNPIFKSESIWKPHALFLMAEYYLAKNQDHKSKEFFEKIIVIENTNPSLKAKAQKRLRTNFSE